MISSLRGSMTRTFLSLQAVQMRLPLRFQQTLKMMSGCMSSIVIMASPVPTFQTITTLSQPADKPTRKLTRWANSHIGMLKMRFFHLNFFLTATNKGNWMHAEGSKDPQTQTVLHQESNHTFVCCFYFFIHLSSFIHIIISHLYSLQLYYFYLL